MIFNPTIYNCFHFLSTLCFLMSMLAIRNVIFFNYTMYFEIILNLQKSYKNSTKSSHKPYTQIPSLLTICISFIILFQNICPCVLVCAFFFSWTIWTEVILPLPLNLKVWVPGQIALPRNLLEMQFLRTLLDLWG